MHMAYSGNELYGLGEQLAEFSMNTNSIEAVDVATDANTNWRAITLISSDYDGKFYSLSRNGFGLICIDPQTQTAKLLVDSEHVEILDSMPLNSNIVAQQCSIIAAGPDSCYLYYPASACIRKLSPIE